MGRVDAAKQAHAARHVGRLPLWLARPAWFGRGPGLAWARAAADGWGEAGTAAGAMAGGSCLGGAASACASDRDVDELLVQRQRFLRHTGAVAK